MPPIEGRLRAEMLLDAIEGHYVARCFAPPVLLRHQVRGRVASCASRANISAPAVEASARYYSRAIDFREGSTLRAPPPSAAAPQRLRRLPAHGLSLDWALP